MCIQLLSHSVYLSHSVSLSLSISLCLKASLNENHWMSAATKQEALAKADAMIQRLGYPDYLDEKVVRTWKLYNDIEKDGEKDTIMKAIEKEAINKSINYKRAPLMLLKGTVDAFYAEYPVEEEKTFLETFIDWIPQRMKDFERRRREERSRERWSKENVGQVGRI